MSLKVDVDVPYGNAAVVTVTEREGATEIAFAAHPHGGPECLWFCFRVRREGSAGQGGGGLRLALRNPQNMLGVGRARLRPVLRRAGGDWERLPPGEAEELPDGRAVIVWTTAAPETHLDVAFCYPYGRPEVEELLDDSGGALRADAIGVSQAGRPLLRVSNSPGEAGGRRPGLYLVARQHSGETPGSWVLDGFLRRVAAAGVEAPVVWAVPLANIDGVEGGDYGKDNFPYDLNRAWGEPPMRHETLAMQRDMRLWAKRCRPVLGLDLHAPGGAESDGVYCFLPKPERLPEMHRESLPWLAAMKESLEPELASGKFERIGDYASRWDTPRFGDFCWRALKFPGLAIETPYQADLTRERYREIGRRLADGVMRRIAAGQPAG